jgi:hypothetical protein
MPIEQERIAMPLLAAELRILKAERRKLYGKAAGGNSAALDKRADALAAQGDAVARRIWRSAVKGWADVAARVMVLDYYFIDWGTSPDQERAVRELVNAVDLMCRSPARKRAKA